jgi:hypothetical protein
VPPWGPKPLSDAELYLITSPDGMPAACCLADPELAMAVRAWPNWAAGTSIKRSLISYDNRTQQGSFI